MGRRSTVAGEDRSVALICAVGPIGSISRLEPSRSSALLACVAVEVTELATAVTGSIAEPVERTVLVLVAIAQAALTLVISACRTDTVAIWIFAVHETVAIVVEVVGAALLGHHAKRRAR